MVDSDRNVVVGPGKAGTTSETVGYSRSRLGWCSFLWLQQTRLQNYHLMCDGSIPAVGDKWRLPIRHLVLDFIESSWQNSPRCLQSSTGVWTASIDLKSRCCTENELSSGSKDRLFGFSIYSTDPLIISWCWREMYVITTDTDFLS